jgi:hypothetical protein
MRYIDDSIKKAEPPFCDVDDVTLGSPAILSRIVSDRTGGNSILRPVVFRPHLKVSLALTENKEASERH